jgi:hypothetical protein
LAERRKHESTRSVQHLSCDQSRSRRRKQVSGGRSSWRITVPVTGACCWL